MLCFLHKLYEGAYTHKYYETHPTDATVRTCHYLWSYISRVMDTVMKLAVIAANGRTGVAFVQAALVAGHQVRAGVHHHNPFPPSPLLEVVVCDATKREDIRNLIQGQDVVISLIGHVKGSPTFVQTDAITTIMSVMNELGMRRLVSLTGTGVRFPGDHITLLDRILNGGINLIDPARIRDGRAHVRALQASHLDWTIIRVLKLQNTPARSYRLTEHGPTKLYVGRAEVALALLDILVHQTYIGKAPMLSRK